MSVATRLAQITKLRTSMLRPLGAASASPTSNSFSHIQSVSAIPPLPQGGRQQPNSTPNTKKNEYGRKRMTGSSSLGTKTVSGLTEGNIVSISHDLMSWYPPDIDVKALANQDLRIAALNLKDVWIESRQERERRAEARGKMFRVKVVEGPQPAPDKKDAKGKRKK
ncbi:hypothetical protein HK102_014091 [Quaeritorhiza haematococci]|nr:hypothetical protein HK102_014091 [Quaeritorhiza haematococci]